MPLTDLDEEAYIRSIQESMKVQETATSYLVHTVKIVGILASLAAVFSGYDMVTRKLYS